MNRYYVNFERTMYGEKGQYNENGMDLKESVWVLVETKIDLEDDSKCDKWESVAWKALWKQYPQWECPYNQSNPPKTKFEKLRHCFSSVFIGTIETLI